MNNAPPQTEIASFGLVIRTTHTQKKKAFRSTDCEFESQRYHSRLWPDVHEN